MLDRLYLLYLKHITKNKKIQTCVWLEGALSFMDGNVAYCPVGNSSNYRKIYSIYENFDGKIDIEHLAKEIRNSRINIATNGKSPHNYNLIQSCKGCYNLKERICDIDLSYYPKLKHIKFSDNSLCNSKCTYCNSWKNTKFENGEYLPKNGGKDSYDIMPIIKQLAQKHMITEETVVDFAGGEPTIYRQFEEALNYLLDFGLKKILVFSNIINYSEAIERGIRTGKVYLTVSVDAGSEELHEKVKGVKSYKSVYKNLEKYSKVKQSPNQIISKYVIVPHLNDSEEEIQIWINKSKEIGITNLELNVDDREIEKDFNTEVAKRIKDLCDFFETKAKENNMNYDILSNVYALYQYFEQNT